MVKRENKITVQTSVFLLGSSSSSCSGADVVGYLRPVLKACESVCAENTDAGSDG